MGISEHEHDHPTGSLSRMVNGVANWATVSWARAKIARGWLQPVTILPYRGYGTDQRLYLSGRVLETPGLAGAGDADSVWRNVRAMGRRFTSGEIPGAIVQARFNGQNVEMTTDVEGFFSLELDADGRHGWQQVELELIGPLARDQDAARVTGHVLVPRSDAGFGVISDLDDTVIRTGLTEGLKAARIIFLNNARTRLPYAGVAAFYQALRGGGDGQGDNPVFYVSSSPWNLYDLLTEFLDYHRIPIGPLFLADWGIEPGRWLRPDTSAFKRERILRILDLYPRMRFVLIGDSGQHDPEIYADVVRGRPEQILAVYIRDVTPESRDAAVRELAAGLDVPVTVSEDSLTAARHAAELGLIAPSAVEAIAADKRRDQQG